MLAQRCWDGGDGNGKDAIIWAAMSWAMGQDSVYASIIMNNSICSLQCLPVEEAHRSSREDVHTGEVMQLKDECESEAGMSYSSGGADVDTNGVMLNKDEHASQRNNYKFYLNISISNSMENKQPEQLETCNPERIYDESVASFTSHYHAHWALYDFDGIKVGSKYLSFPKHALLFVPPQDSYQGWKYGLILNPVFFTEFVPSPPLIQITQKGKTESYITWDDRLMYGAMMSGYGNVVSQVINI